MAIRAIISLTAAAALVLVQTAAVAQDAAAAADRMDGYGSEGQAFGRASVPDPKSLFGAQSDGTPVLFPGAASPTPIDPSTLFGGADGSEQVPELTELYGKSEELTGQGSARLDTLATEQSPEGEAYRVLLDSKGAVAGDVTQDPIITSSDQILAAIDQLQDEFGACTETSTFTPGEATVHVPDLRYCERLILSGSSCDITHTLVLAQSSESAQTTVSAFATFPNEEFAYKFEDRPQATTVTLDYAAGRATWNNYTFVACGHDDSDVCVEPASASAPIPSMDLAATCGGSTSSDPVGAFRVERGPPMSATGPFQPTRSEISNVVAPSCSNALKAQFTVSGGDCRYEGDKESRMLRCYPVDYTSSLDTYKVVSDTWQPPDCIAAAASQTSVCPSRLTVVDGPQDPEGCWSIGGKRICPGSAVFQSISRPPFDLNEEHVSRLALSVRNESKCELTPGTFCVEDVHGTTTCDDTVEPITNTCEELVNNPQCRYVSTSPVVDAEDADGNSYAFEDQYDCGHEVTTPTTVRNVSLLCPGSIRGIGNDFVTPEYETNDSFAKVAATLEAANMMAMDTDCTVDETTGAADCVVFKGDARTCKKAMGGVVNCCESPAGVSLQQYMQLAFAVRELDSAIMTLDNPSAIRGAWEYMTGPINDAWSVVSDAVSTAFNSVTGSTVATATDAAAQSLLTTIEQELMHTVAEWANSLFGEAATNLLFSTAAEGAASGGGAAVVEGQVAGGALQLGGGAAIIGSALSMVMLAYTIYQVTMVIIQMAYKCGKTEYETAAKRQLKSCHYIGTYCDQKILGFCTVRKQSYCCFASPISRILQEQMRPQLGMSWGSAKNPNCQGLAIAEFSKVDWDKVDLSEWLGILIETDMLPDAGTITPEALTGMGRDIAAGMPSEPRMTTPDRTLERLKDIQFDNWMNTAKDELLWATPGPKPGQ
jgi:conjugal transfer mating pair stabilization protein TraN